MNNDKEYFIKICMPAFNVENTFRSTLDSIVEQSFKNFALVICDDCSTDRTYDIAKEYCQRYNNIFLTRTCTGKNSSIARNMAFKYPIKSKFTWFIDSDDKLNDINALKKIYEKSIEDDYSAICINAYMKYNENIECLKIYDVLTNPCLNGPVFKIMKTELMPMWDEDIDRGCNDIIHHLNCINELYDKKIAYIDEYLYFINGCHHHYSELDEAYWKMLLSKIQKITPNSIVIQNTINSRIDQIQNRMETNKKQCKDRNISILMSSFPHRHKFMLSAVKQLIDQCDNFYLWLNEYSEVPKELKQYGNKIHVKINVENLKDNGRFTFLNECKDDYCFICDDDIDWPNDYVQNTLECLHRYNDNIIAAYYIYSTEDFFNEHRVDTEHRCLGSGTCAFIPSKLDADITYDELKSMYDCEIFIVNECIKKGMKIISPKRRANFCQWKMIDGNYVNADAYAMHMSGSYERIRYTQNYINQTGRHSLHVSITYDDLAKRSILVKVHQTNLINEVIKHHCLFMPPVSFGYTDVKASHFAAVKYAKNNGYPYVFILEDNIYPVNDVKNALKQALLDIPCQYDLITFGNVDFITGKRSNNYYISKFKLNRGSHAYMLSKECFDKFLSYETDSSIQTIDQIFLKIDNRAAYHKCLFIQTILNGQQIECKCSNANIIKECPNIEDILNKQHNNVYIVHKNEYVDIYKNGISNICSLIKQLILAQNNNIIQFNKLDTCIKMYLPFVDDVIQRTIFNNKDFFEAKELDIIKKYIDTSKTVLDIGANIGNHSIYFAKVLKCKQVIAFEPQRVMQEIFEKNIQLNDISNVKLFKTAVSSGCNCLKMTRFTSNNYGATSLTVADDGEYDSMSLDSLCLEDVQFVKIDVEGHELEVLKGGKALFTEQKPVIFIEIWKECPSKAETFKLLKEYGYRLEKKLALDNYIFVHE